MNNRTTRVMHTPSDFGVFLRNERKSLNLSQIDLAKIIGITPQSVNAYETGRTSTPTFTIPQLKRLLKLFGKSIHQIPNGEDSVLAMQDSDDYVA
jgi:transcriptional regulator with XRE-family HTH domain